MSQIDPIGGLHNGQMLPAFTLPGPDGMPYSPWNYKQREHLIILILQDATTSAERAVLQSFARQFADFREEYCAILVVTANTVLANLRAQEELLLPFPLLADPQGEVSTRYTLRQAGIVCPGVILADRYGEVYQQWVAPHEDGLPPITELLDTLRYLNRLCTP